MLFDNEDVPWALISLFIFLLLLLLLTPTWTAAFLWLWDIQDAWVRRILSGGKL